MLQLICTIGIAFLKRFIFSMSPLLEVEYGVLWLHIMLRVVFANQQPAVCIECLTNI